MAQLRRFLLPIAAGAAVAVAVLSAPVAAADCETLGGSPVTGGQTTECVTPGNAEVSTSPGVFPNQTDVMYGFPAFGII